MAIRLLDERDIAEIRGSSANAIKGKVTGAVVSADDVSPMEHSLNVKVKSKNLFYFTRKYEAETQGIGITIEPYASAIIANGTATGAQAFSIAQSTIELEAGTYTASIFGANVITTTYDRLYVEDMTNGGILVNYIKTGEPKTFTLNKKAEVSVCIIFGEGTSYNNATIGVQIEKGDTATEYEPWINPTTVIVTRCGRNLLSSMVKSTTIAGVTFTVNDDGSVTANGTATELVQFVLNREFTFKAGVKYTLSGCPKGGGITSYRLDNTDKVADDGNGGEVTYGTDTTYPIRIRIASGTAVSNLVFKPMIEFSKVATKVFESYKGSSHTPSANGTCDDVTSLSPIINLLSDNENATIECEYIKDSNKVIEKLTNAVIALGGTI